MAVNVDIFNPQKTVIAKGLEGKSFLIYGSNSLGKTAQAVRMSKPFVIATESGLNATVGVAYNRVTTWGDFKKLVKQFTSKATVEKARALYDTIIIDEVYASSLLCQDFIIATYGEGALTLGDGNGKVNLYQMYEKEYFKTINLLLSCNYTVVFIGHAQEKDGYVTPKGDKRCIDPIRDFVDYVIYLQSNGVDENGKVIPSSAYLAETDKFFARSRFDTTPTYLPVWSAEALEEAVNIGISGKVEATGVAAVTYDEQKAQNTSVKYDYDKVMDQLQEIGARFANAGQMEALTEIVEETLGVGKKVSQCTKKQIDALLIILDNLNDKAVELGI
ncbi:MAG: ATP-binding protein [Elusimicrobiales bacterium]|nr:ATP-binding protein [Elusimicrobiales bacterium]